jgi:hypothetical protein
VHLVDFTIEIVTNAPVVTIDSRFATCFLRPGQLITKAAIDRNDEL